MKNWQKGMTLIELMIVVAILGILAAIAIPAYLDYTIRARVSEGVFLISAAKTGVAEYRESTGFWPDTNSRAGVAGSESINGDYTDWVQVTAGGPNGESVIRVEYSDLDITPGQMVYLASHHGGSTVWYCSGTETAGVTGGATNVTNRHRPPVCRD